MPHCCLLISAALESIMFVICYSIADTVFVTTPPVNETTHRMAIILEISNGSVGSPIDTIHTNRTFDYRRDPVFSDIRPRDHLIVWVFSNTCTLTYFIIIDSQCNEFLVIPWHSNWVVSSTFVKMLAISVCSVYFGSWKSSSKHYYCTLLWWQC